VSVVVVFVDFLELVPLCQILGEFNRMLVLLRDCRNGLWFGLELDGLWSNAECGFWCG